MAHSAGNSKIPATAANAARARGRRRAVLLGMAVAAASLPVVGLSPARAATMCGGTVTERCWETLKPMPTTGDSWDATAGIGGDRRIYYMGGHDGNFVYDISANQWSPLPEPSIPRTRGAAAVTGPDGRIYLIGGLLATDVPGFSYVALTQNTVVEAYDPADNTWSRVADIGIPRFGAGAAVGSDGRIYVMGGVLTFPRVAGDPRTDGRYVEAYDPANPELGWRPVTPLQSAGDQAEAVSDSDGRVYVFWNRDFSSSPKNPAVFDPAQPADGWQKIPLNPSNHLLNSYDVAVGRDGRIYAIGGYKRDGTEYFDVVEAYDPLTDSWSTEPSMPTKRGWPAAASGVDGRIYVMAGLTRTAASSNDVWLKTVEAYTPSGAVPAPTTAIAPGLFRPLSSARIHGPAALGETATANVQVTGAGGVPTTGVSGVALSITVTNPSKASFMTVWPTGAARPTASALDWTAGETVANAAQGKVGEGGKVSLFNAHGTATVTVDVVGWYADATTTSPGGRYHPLKPKRILDTRGEDLNGDGVSDQPLGAPMAALAPSDACTSPLEFQVAGAGDVVPTTGVSAVVVNLTATPKVPGPGESLPTTGSGSLVAWPAGEAAPTGSNVPYDLFREGRRSIPTLAVAKVGAEGKINVCNRAPAGTWPMHAVADVVGWYSTESTLPVGTRGSSFVPLTPARVLDTRPPCVSARSCIPSQVIEEGATATPIGQDSTMELQVSGRGGVPESGATAVVLNVTATEPTHNSFLTLWPTSSDPVARVTRSDQPVVFNLNYVPGQTVPNLVVVKVGEGGKVSLYNKWGNVHVIADVVGWFAGAYEPPLVPDPS